MANFWIVVYLAGRIVIVGDQPWLSSQCEIMRDLLAPDAAKHGAVVRCEPHEIAPKVESLNPTP